MSADSPKRPSRSVPVIVPPQAVSDRSLIDSVTGFLNEVTLSNTPQGDPKDTIIWARFETNADISDPTFGCDWDSDNGIAPPLLLILGYGTGIQVWAIPANGEAVEVLSWRHGSVRALRILPQPDGENGPDQIADEYAAKRPLMGICDSNATGSSPQFCSVNFVSLRDADQVKCIKFKNPIQDILANRSVVAISFLEKVAVFDAKTFEDRLTVTTCHPCPGLNINPIALGPRWMAYAERKMLPSKRSSGGCDCDGVASYTATVLNAAKSLGKGLREFGGQMAAGFAGGGTSSSPCSPLVSQGSEEYQPGVVTIIDTKYSIKDTSPTTGAPISVNGTDPIVVHFIAHSDAIAALSFNYSGMLLLTADRRGHDFHVFLILPNPCGPSLSAVHHLYVLHRGDTSAKVQDIEFSLDSRWVSVSTIRGTTHVFPITPYGGTISMRTHGSRQVVNRLSRFHRSAGLSADGRSNSPVHVDSATSNTYAYNNPRGPPFPRPTVVTPLAQLRQPTMLGQSNPTNQQPKSSGSRQRLSSYSDESTKPLRVCATFAKARAWLLDPPGTARDLPSLRMQNKPVDSLFVMAGHGALLQYDLDVKAYSNVPKDKVCDDTSIELEVEAKAQWNLLRKETSTEMQPPLPFENWLLKERMDTPYSDVADASKETDADVNWLSQVEIVTHAGPHRRLWMGPQFTFKTYNTPTGAPLSHIDSESVEVGLSVTGNRPARSNPMNMPLSSGGRSAVPVLIESGSCSSYEQSPRLSDQYRHDHMGSDFSLSTGDSQLREDLADAMRESPGVYSRDSGLSSAATPARNVLVSVAKVVNPLGTVTTITESPTDLDMDHFGPTGRAGSGNTGGCSNQPENDDDFLIHENCDEALFRPVVAVFGSSETDLETENIDAGANEKPAAMGQDLIVPVIEKDAVENSRKKIKINKDALKKKDDIPVEKFEELSFLNKKSQNKSKEPTVEKEEVIPETELKKSIEKDASECDEVANAKGKKKGPSQKYEKTDVKILSELKSKAKKSKNSGVVQSAPLEIIAMPKITAQEPIQDKAEKLKKKILKKVQKSNDGKKEKTPPRSDDSEENRERTPPEDEEIFTVSLKPKFDEVDLPKDEDILTDFDFESLKSKFDKVDPPKQDEESFAVSLKPKSDEVDSSPLVEVTALKPKPRKKNLQLLADPLWSPAPPTPLLSFADMIKARGVKEPEEITPSKESKPASLENYPEEAIENIEPIDESSDRETQLRITRDKWNKIIETSSDDTVIRHYTFLKESSFMTNDEQLETSSDDCFQEPMMDDIKIILDEEILALSDDCSRIQASLLRDATVATTTTKSTKTMESSIKCLESDRCDYDDSTAARTQNILEELGTERISKCRKAVFAKKLKKLKEESNPLEPMIINLNDLPPDSSKDITLIEFDTPPYEKPIMPTASTYSTKYPKSNAALLSGLRITTTQQMSSSPPPQQQQQQDSQDSDYKSLEFEIDETYLSLEPATSSCSKYFETSSSDDTEDSSQSKPKDDEMYTKQQQDEDEELQPLISSTASQDASLENSVTTATTTTTATMNITTTKGMPDSDSLPDEINQIDVNKQQQASGKKKNKKKRR